MTDSRPKWVKSANGTYTQASPMDEEAALKAAIRRLQADGATKAAKHLQAALVAHTKRSHA
jgi:hypothetical protein